MELLAANAEGDAPFMPSVVVAPVEIADTVVSEVDSFTAQVPRAASSGAHCVPGTQRGLSGGVAETPV